jgi:hypothetical protein
VTDQPGVVLGGAEGTGAEIAWVVIYGLCWILMIAPFALWWAGVRTPRSERRARRAESPVAAHASPIADASEPEETPVRAAG